MPKRICLDALALLKTKDTGQCRCYYNSTWTIHLGHFELDLVYTLLIYISIPSCFDLILSYNDSDAKHKIRTVLDTERYLVLKSGINLSSIVYWVMTVRWLGYSAKAKEDYLPMHLWNLKDIMISTSAWNALPWHSLGSRERKNGTLKIILISGVLENLSCEKLAKIGLE